MEKLSKEAIISKKWNFISDKNSHIEYFNKVYKNKFTEAIEGFVFLEKEIDINLNSKSIIRISKTYLGSSNNTYIYIGKCPTISDFDYICDLLDI